MRGRAPRERRRRRERDSDRERGCEDDFSHADILIRLDNLTHTLFAVTLGRTALGRAGRGTTAALVIASNAPDIDVVATVGSSLNYLKWHRGPTHGPLGVIVLGVAVAGIVWAWPALIARLKPNAARHADDRPQAPFHMLVALSMLGVLLHILMDLPTSYGTRLLSPFDWHWYSVDWLPIIDIYLLMALVAGMGFGHPSAAAKRRNAAIVLTLMAANYGIRAAAHHQALDLAPRLFGPTLPPRCESAAGGDAIVDRWPTGGTPVPPAGSTRCLMEIAAMPTFTSPFRWRVIAHMSNAYEIHDVDLLDARFREAETTDAFWRLALRYPNVWTPYVRQAAASPAAQTFLGFSRFPAARAAVDAQGNATVRWNDMRFVGGIVTLDQPVRAPGPFTLAIRIGADGQIVSQTLGR